MLIKNKTMEKYHNIDTNAIIYILNSLGAKLNTCCVNNSNYCNKLCRIAQ